jgi:hypothetical protein
MPWTAQKRFAAERIAMLVEDKRISEADEAARNSMSSQRHDELLQRVQKAEAALQSTTKDYIVGAWITLSRGSLGCLLLGLSMALKHLTRNATHQSLAILLVMQGLRFVRYCCCPQFLIAWCVRQCRLLIRIGPRF